jgi:hypothetical protein
MKKISLIILLVSIFNVSFSQKKKAKEVIPQNLDKKVVIANIDG